MHIVKPTGIGGDSDDLGLLSDLIEDRPKPILTEKELRMIKSRTPAHGKAAADAHDQMIKRKKRHRRM